MEQQYISGMSLEEQIGQVLMVGFYGTTPSPEIIDLIQNHHISNIILFKRNIVDIEQTRALTDSLQRIAREAGHRFPLLIATDQENGVLRRFDEQVTIFPGNMSLGAIASSEVVRDVAVATGRELKALGINMNLAPVVDVNNNPANPVIGVRSFGEDPTEVARLASAMVQGYREAGVVTSLKHFPGHGDTAVDSHLALPVIPFSLDRLEQVELVPFKRCIEDGADTVMIAHLALPHLMHSNELPSSVSPEIVQGLLRERLGYQGVIITDCLEMNAVAETIGTERGSVMALQAGNDIALISHHYAQQYGSIAAIKAALQDGSLSSTVIGAAAERVLALKARYLSWEDFDREADLSLINNAAHQQLSERTYEQAITLVRDEQHLLPLQLGEGAHLALLLLQPESYTMAVDAFEPEQVLAQRFLERHANTSVLSVPAVRTDRTDDEEQALRQALHDADLFVVVTVNANLDRHQEALMSELLAMGRPVVGVAVFNPYDLLAFPHLGTYLVTYEYTPPALTAAVRVLFGEIAPRGHLPVSLPGLYERS